MDNEPGTSIEADKNLAAPEDCWTTNLKNISEFSYQKLKEHLVDDAKKNSDSSGYRLLKAGYSRQFVVKPNVKREIKAFTFLCGVMYLLKCGKKQYIVYVNLDQSTGDVAIPLKIKC